MKPLFKNTTTYSGSSYKKFVEFHNEKYGIKYNVFNIIFLILLFYCFSVSLTGKNLLMTLIFILTIISFLIYRIYMPINTFRKTLLSQSKKEKNTFTFLFYDKYFTVNKVKVQYSKLYKIFETKNFFYLYLTKDQSAILSKKCFEIGTSNEFTNFIKKKCIFKYALCK